MSERRPASVLFLGRGGELAQRLVLSGLARGWRLHVRRTRQDAFGALAQVLFDVIVYEDVELGLLQETLKRDPDLARVPTVAILEPERQCQASPTLALEADCGLDDVLAFLVQSGDPAGPLERSELQGRLEANGSSTRVRILELRPGHIEAVALPDDELPPLGSTLRVFLPWLEHPTHGTCTVADAVTRHVRIGAALRLV